MLRVYPSHRHTPLRVRVLADALASEEVAAGGHVGTGSAESASAGRRRDTPSVEHHTCPELATPSISRIT